LLSTTQIYAQVSIRRLKTVHSLTRPSAKIDWPTATAMTANGAMGDEGVVTIPPSAADEPRSGAAELMATLAADNEEG
jgi:hypothetical protein